VCITLKLADLASSKFWTLKAQILKLEHSPKIPRRRRRRGEWQVMTELLAVTGKDMRLLVMQGFVVTTLNDTQCGRKVLRPLPLFHIVTALFCNSFIFFNLHKISHNDKAKTGIDIFANVLKNYT
jgi:hypothetical protein